MSSARPDGKPVWITREHLNEILASYGPDIADSRARLEAAWDAAPADPAESIRAVHIEYGCDHDAPTIRSAAEERRTAHVPDMAAETCCSCDREWPCPDRVFADLVITNLNNADYGTDAEGDNGFRCVPDPEDAP